jgi:predicted TIM-barrel fold metal-dependent hydrolase
MSVSACDGPPHPLRVSILPFFTIQASRFPRIDIHQHVMRSAQDKLNHNKIVGFRTPQDSLPWTTHKAHEAMERLKIDVVMASHPPSSAGEASESHRAKTREFNDYLKNTVVASDPKRFGLLAHLPFLDDIQGCLAEIAYAFDTLGADGVSMTSSYGVGSDAKYVGDDLYDPIWAELDRRQAVVFLHGGMVPSSTPFPHEFLGLPISEVPNETFKAAAHLVVSGRKRKYSNVKIILTHAGGSTAFLAARVAVLSNYMGCPLTTEEILEDFKTFYVDTALSGYEVNLQAVETFHGIHRILFGSDYFGNR